MSKALCYLSALKTNVWLIIVISVLSVSFLIVHHHLFYLRAQLALSLALQVSPLFCFPFHLYVPHVSQRTSSLCREDKVPSASVLTVCTETWWGQKVRKQPASTSRAVFVVGGKKPLFLPEHLAPKRFSIVCPHVHVWTDTQQTLKTNIKYVVCT